MEYTSNNDEKQELKHQSTFDESEEYQEKHQDQESSKRMVNGHLIARSFYRFIAIQKSYGITLGIQIFLTILYYQLDYSNKPQKSSILLILNILTIPSIFLSILSHVTYNDLKTAQLKQLEATSIQGVILNVFIILLQPYFMLENTNIDIFVYDPSIQDFFAQTFKINYIFVLGFLVKIFLIICCVLNANKFKNPRSSRVCKIYGCPNSNLYTIKCCFKQSPIALISITFMMCFLGFSFAFRVGERFHSADANQFDEFLNSVWLVIITMSSVGYGDIYPRTTVGRIIGFICTLCGALTVSIMVVVVINTFELEQNQTKSLNFLKKLEQKKQIKTIAAKYLRISLWRIWKNYTSKKKDPYCYIEVESREQKFIRGLLRDKIRMSKFTDGNPKGFGFEIRRQFQSAKYAIENLEQNTDQILHHLSNQYFLNLEEIKEDSAGNGSFLGY